MPPRILSYLICLAWLACLAHLPGAQEPLTEEEKTLREAGLETDAASLLQFFRTRTVAPADQARLASLVRQLGDRSFDVRERAAADLVKQGRLAAPLLHKALKDPDPEVARRAAACLEAIGSDAEQDRVRAAAQLLAARRPAEAVTVLLAYLPRAAEELEEDLLRALDRVGLHDGQAAPPLVAALRDPEPSRRAAAARVVGRARPADQQAAVRPLLSDPDPKVRLRAAQGLTAGGHKEAVPVLVSLLTEAPLPVAREAEAFLSRIAGDKAPDTALGSAEAARRQCRQAWARWWEQQAGRIELARIDFQQHRPRFPATPPVPPGRRPDVIFVPTPQEVVEQMLELAKVKKGDVVYSLGCGDGRYVVTAARKYGAFGFGCDLDPQRVRDALTNVQQHRVQHLVTIKHADLFTVDLRGATVICLYLLPSLNVKLLPQLHKCRPGTRILSHSFDMEGVKPEQVLRVKTRAGDERTVYLWITPLKKQ